MVLDSWWGRSDASKPWQKLTLASNSAAWQTVHSQLNFNPMAEVYCVVMAGGIGSRFWPMSRQSNPKQFLDILGSGSSLIQLTYERFQAFSRPDQFMVVTSDEYVSLTKEHLTSLKEDQILAEPSRKNTAPCIAYAAYKLHKINPEAVMVITPADHVVLKQAAFEETMHLAIDHAAESGNLVTIGIKPSRPDSGYGYIQFHHDSTFSIENVKKVKTFTEKPDVELALQFLQSGDFYWNSGMFVWKVSSIVKAFQTLMPDLANLFEDHLEDLNTEAEAKALNEIYGQFPNISIDYAVMEKANNVDVVLGDFGWSDLGTYGSLYEQLAEKEKDNVILGGTVKAYQTDHSILKVPDGKLAVLQGLSNYIVIDTPDVLLICKKDEEQRIKQFVQKLKDEKRTDVL